MSLRATVVPARPDSLALLGGHDFSRAARGNKHVGFSPCGTYQLSPFEPVFDLSADGLALRLTQEWKLV